MLANGNIKTESPDTTRPKKKGKTRSIKISTDLDFNSHSVSDPDLLKNVAKLQSY